MIKAHSKEVRYAAQLMYVTGSYTAKEISKRLGIPYETIRSWAQREQWGEMRKEVDKALQKDMVRRAKRQIGMSYALLDSLLNRMTARLMTRLEAPTDEVVPIDKELDVMNTLLKVVKAKNDLLRGVQATAGGGGPGSPDMSTFSPIRTGTGVQEIEDLALSDLAADKKSSLSGGFFFDDNTLSGVMETIPELRRAQAELVLGTTDDLDLNRPVIADAIRTTINDLGVDGFLQLGEDDDE